MYCWLYRVHKQYTAGVQVRLYVGCKARGCGWAVVEGGAGYATGREERYEVFVHYLTSLYAKLNLHTKNVNVALQQAHDGTGRHQTHITLAG
jgi:hypothetical protein